MNALLKPIEAACVERPQYDNARVAQGFLWMRDNDASLRGYYLTLGGRLPDHASTDNLREFARAQRFLSFSACQWDRERMRF